jgi:aldose 1-epimerase
MCAEIAQHGATLLRWTVNGVDLIAGYESPQELANQDGVRSGMMVPFSNRIPAGKYTFDGRHSSYDSAGETVMHGVVREVDFDVDSVQTGEASANIRLTTTALSAGLFPGYPFAVDVSIDVTVTPGGLEFVITGSNVGEVAAPFGSGWHPYFTIGDTPIEQLLLSVPADTRIVSGPDLIPRDGELAYAPATGEWSFAQPRAIGQQEINTAFFGLRPEADGLIHSRLTDGSATIDVWQERGGMHVFTADGITRPRQSVAMESVEFMTNAVNRSDQAHAIRLEPGASRSFRFGASASFIQEN